MSERVTANDIAEALGQTKQNVNQRADKECWVHNWQRVRGGRQKMYPVLPLPPEVRAPVLALLVKRETVTAAAQSAGAVTGAKLKVATVIDGKAAAAARQLGLIKFAALPEQGKRRAQARAALAEIAARYAKIADMKKRRGDTLFCEGYNAGLIEVPEWVRAELASCSINSLDNWRKAIAAEGLAGVGGKYGQHRVGSGVIDSNAPLAAFIKGMLFEFPHASAKHVMRAIRVRFEVEEHPNFRTLQRWISAWKVENEPLLLSIANPDAFRSKHQPAGGRKDAQIFRLNQRWETDSTKGDLLLADGKRHNIVGVIDVYSRRLKLHVSRTSSALAVASCLRRALLDWGVPEQLGTDNGSDFVSDYIQRAVLGLGIEQDIAPPFTPEHKPFIERSFGTFCRDLVELLPGYVGHDVAGRKAIESRRSFAQRLFKSGKGEQPVELRMTPEKLQEFCDQWTDNVYGREIHSTIGCSPAEKAASWMEPINTIRDERALDVLLAPAPGAGSAGGDGIRTVRKKGIEVDGAWFDAGELGGLEGTKVRVLLDEADIGEIYVFTREGKFVAKAVCTDRKGISHQQISVERRVRHNQAKQQGKKVAAALRKEANTGNIAFDILQRAAIRDGNVTFFPTPTVEHTTETLRQAAIAAEHAVGAAPSRACTHEALPANVTVLPTMPGARPAFSYPEERIRWMAANLSEVTDRDRDWMKAEARRSRFFADEFAGLIARVEQGQNESATG